MNLVLFFVIAISIFLIAAFERGVTGVFVALLCAVSFIWGCSFYRDIVQENADNSELLEISGKYYEIKHVKDKVK
ncbi:hypothetical protein [Rodentibacter pneumotropicus]|uniref:Uncharacterized protein n=1 Tax=Rodentibacter pneumotropicus TaxID=758 RepID=A0A4S2Q7L1_9PAST|nr:hypothetical protein [Rodentibacter pneumotropicus]THA11937.1 hypothetical protein D3M76_10600 [Rodentibacter pneumotropicus]